MTQDQPTHAQSEILLLIEAKFAEILPDFETLTLWLTEMGMLADRYTAAGGALEDLQVRFDNSPTPMGGRFFFSAKGSLWCP